MDLSALATVISVLIVLSIASERLVEIIKGFIPYLDKKNDDQKKEGKRKAYLHIIAIFAGILTAFLAKKTLGNSVPESWNTTTGILALGLLASGGSGFWNSILDYVNEVKKLKNIDVTKANES